MDVDASEAPHGLMLMQAAGAPNTSKFVGPISLQSFGNGPCATLKRS